MYIHLVICHHTNHSLMPPIFHFVAVSVVVRPVHVAPFHLGPMARIAVAAAHLHASGSEQSMSNLVNIHVVM